MALLARKGTDGVMYAVVKAHNATRAELAVVGEYYHADVTSIETGDFMNPGATAMTVDHATATTHATAAEMAYEFAQKFNLHLADDLAHKIADTDNVITDEFPTAATSESDLADFITGLKTAYNLHIADTDFHYTADEDNDVATTNATDDASSITLINALKTAFNAHIVGAPLGYSVDLKGP